MLSVAPNSKNTTSLLSVPSIWQALRWLFMHRQYAGIGIALSEYALKLSIDKLRPGDKEFYVNCLKVLGFDVNSVGLSSVANSLFKSITPSSRSGTGGPGLGAHFIEHLVDSPHEALTEALQSTIPPPQNVHVVDMLFHLMESVKNLAYHSIPDSSHLGFAKYLTLSGWSSGGEISQKDLKQNAERHYPGSSWLDVGLLTLKEKRAKLGKVSEDILAHWLRDTHTQWQEWAAAATPLLNKLGFSALHEVHQKVEQAHAAPSLNSINNAQSAEHAPLTTTAAATTAATSISSFTPPRV